MNKEKQDETERMILLYFVEKKRTLMNQKEKLEEEIQRLAETNKKLKDN